MPINAMSPVDIWFKNNPTPPGMENRNQGIVPPWLADGEWPGLPPLNPDTPHIMPINTKPIGNASIDTEF